MAYQKTTWVNNQTTVDADNMNHIENGIADLDQNKQDIIGSVIPNEQTEDNYQALLLNENTAIGGNNKYVRFNNTTYFRNNIELTKTGGGKITGLANPVNDTDAATKKYVDENGGGTVDQTYSPTSTNAQSGIAVAGAIATKQDKFATVAYSSADDENTLWLDKHTLIAGRGLNDSVQFMGRLDMGMHKIQNVGMPTATGDAVNKIYADSKTASSFKTFSNPTKIFLNNNDIELDNIQAEYKNMTATTSVDVVVKGKNLVKPTNIYHVEVANPKTWVNQPNNNVIWLPIENGKMYTITQTVFGAKARYALVDEISNTVRVDCFQPPYVTVTTEIAGFVQLSSSHPVETFINKFNRKYLVAWVHTTTDSVTLDEVLDGLQVEEGATATSISPYTETTYTINIGHSVTAGILDLKAKTFVVGATTYNITPPTINLPQDQPITISLPLAVNTYFTFNTGVSTAVKNINNPLYGKKIVAMGDSMVYGHSLPDRATWLALLAERNNMTYVNYGLNGGTMTHRINPTTSKADGVVDRYTTMDSDADYVVIFAGTNDCDQNITLGNEDSANTSEFYGALNAITDGLQAKYPTAKIVFFTPYARAGLKDRSKQYRDAICTACERGGIPVFDNIKNGGINWDIQEQLQAYTLQDTYHLNYAGMIMASEKYEKFLKSI